LIDSDIYNDVVLRDERITTTVYVLFITAMLYLKKEFTEHSKMKHVYRSPPL